MSTPNKLVLRVWHRVKHDDYTVSEIDTDWQPRKWVQNAAKDGGFWTSDVFVPWHSVNYIELKGKND